MDALDEFAQWAADLRADDVPGDVLQLARAEIANTIAAAVDGHLGEAGRRTESLRRHAGNGDCSTLGTDGVDPASACFLNATCSMAYDFDDFIFMGHSSHSAVFAGLAAAELEEQSIREFAVSVAVANELEGRLGAAAAVGPHNGQMWTYIHQAGAAAVVARSLDGKASTIRDAVAAALYQIPHPNQRGFIRGDAKFTTAAAPTASGFRLGLYAVSGGRGADAAALGSGGCLESYADLPLGEMLDGWGESWVTRSLSFKPRPGCAYLQSVLENGAQLREEGLEPDDAEEIRVRASLPTVLMERLSAAHTSDPSEGPGYSTVHATFSVRIGLAIALLDDGLDRENLSRDAIDERHEAIDDLADRITVIHDWDHTAALIRGVGEGLDLWALGERYSTFSWLGALRDIQGHHEYASLPSDLGTVPNLEQLRDLLRSVGADWGDEPFDLGRAAFERIRFDFGSTVEADTDSETLSSERDAYRGACGDSVDERVELVRDKCAAVAHSVVDEEETDAFLDAVFEGDGDLDAITGWMEDV